MRPTRRRTPLAVRLPDEREGRGDHAGVELHQSLDVDRLTVKELMVDQGPSLRRYMPRAMGRAFKVLKKTSHIQLTLSDEAPKKRRS